MPELTPTGAVEVAQRQVRRVRRRKNLYELQRTLYLTLAAGAGAASILLPLALFAPTRLFAAAAWSGAAVLVGVALLLAGATRRRWLLEPAAVQWIEDHGDLGGRLRTLLEIETRPPARRGAFFALLAFEVGRDLTRWAPARLAPRRVPRAALASALVASAVLALVLRFAAVVVPALPQVIAGGSGGETELDGEAGALESGRIVVAPGADREHGDDEEAAPGDSAPEPSTLARLPERLQEGIRRQVWGEAWERVREALAHAAENAPGVPASRDEEGEPREDGEDEWEVARAPAGGPIRRRRPGIGEQAAGRDERDAGERSADATTTDSSSEANEDGGGEGGTGAGNGTGPALFGPRTGDDGPANASFELSLAARMRAERVTGRRGAGTAPAPDPDAHPELAGDQRRETAAHRMTVPATYETVVREVFAHRRAETGEP